ncbi:MAG TPA: bifunctional hydroxymethylpyrimidine kinase/phosphomethylpyrimidine kinase [Bryobacteraceae bacterium]|jgi:hydroxymethylpyrimidine/phosphomethylpyrimidine kinase|nr:bifunctional hydroxymethylpyrimidine kinase/phosphomethylpyrimidine kinase [Bryobacteraceae bacterium]
MATVALSIAGSDPSGGAGIQADLKTFHQFGVYGEAVLTLITVQNTQRVSRVEPLHADLVAEQLRAVLDDIPPNAAKIGALGSIEVVEAVAKLAKSFQFPLVVDPVMISKHGGRLLPPKGEEVLKHKLLPLAFLVTPNIPEAESLTGMKIRNEEEMAIAGDRILAFGCHAVLVKGGHLPGEPNDILRWPASPPLPFLDRSPYSGSRVPTKHTHGTGCTYSAAITAALALGKTLPEAILVSRQYVQNAIETAPKLGNGMGPVNHFADVAARMNFRQTSCVAAD